MTSGRRSSSSDGSPAGTSPGKPGQLRRGGRRGRGVAAEQELERANRLLARELELTQGVAVAADAGARDEDVLLIADADARPVAGEPHELLARANGLAGRLDLQPGLGGEEPALGHERRDRLARVLEVGGRRRGLRGARRPAVAHPAPQVELPGRGEDDALESRAVAHLGAAVRKQIGRRVQLRARKLGVELRLLDARGADAQVGVVRHGFGDRRSQLIVVERRQPVVGHRTGCRRLRRPLRRRLQRRAAPAP